MMRTLRLVARNPLKSLCARFALGLALGCARLLLTPYIYDALGPRLVALTLRCVIPPYPPKRPKQGRAFVGARPWGLSRGFVE